MPPPANYHVVPVMVQKRAETHEAVRPCSLHSSLVTSSIIQSCLPSSRVAASFPILMNDAASGILAMVAAALFYRPSVFLSPLSDHQHVDPFLII